MILDWLYGLVLLAVVLGTPRQTGFSPQDRQDLGLDLSPSPPACRQATEEELHGRGMGREGKAATWQIRGYEICERPIFSYKERDSFATFVADHVADSARRAAILMENRFPRETPDGKAAMDLWGVEVRGDDPQINRHVEFTFQYALADAMGRGRVSRVRSEKSPRLVVVVRRTQDPEFLFDLSVMERRGGKDGDGLQWSRL